MKRNPIYGDAKTVKGCSDIYGTKVTAYFYVGDIIKEGEPFGANEDTAYIDDMGSEWHKGHLLAKSLGGDNKPHNLLPMKEDVNNSNFKKVENLVHKLIENLPKIQKQLNVGDIHIQYTVERVLKPIKVVKGHKFPGQFKYSIDIINDKELNVNSVELFKVFKGIGLVIDTKLSDTLCVE